MRHRLALALLVFALLAAAWASGAFSTFSDLQAVRALLASWGPWAYLLYVTSFAILQPLGIPAFFWVVPAAIVWPFWLAFPLSLAGAAGAASVGFFFARYLARDWVAARLPARLRRFDRRLATHGLGAVIVIRLVFLLAPPTHWLLGLSNVGYGAFVLGTVLGTIPNLVFVTYFGEKAFLWFGATAT